MTIVDTVGAGFAEYSWQSVGMIVFFIMLMLIVVLFMVAFFFFLWWKSFDYKVTIYEPKGQIDLSEKEIEELKKYSTKGGNILKNKNIKFDMISKRKTHGKFTKIKGSPFFLLFKPIFKKLEPIPMALLFSDGVHLLRISKEIFIPIPKPNTIVSIGENTTISVTEHNQWLTWENLMTERINAKYQDIDAQKKMVMYFVIGIAGMVLVGGFILWLIYSSASKGLQAAEKIGAIADKLGGSTPPG